MCTLSVKKALCKLHAKNKGELAQLVECLDGIEKVGGSTPPFSTLPSVIIVYKKSQSCWFIGKT